MFFVCLVYSGYWHKNNASQFYSNYSAFCRSPFVCIACGKQMNLASTNRLIFCSQFFPFPFLWEKFDKKKPNFCNAYFAKIVFSSFDFITFPCSFASKALIHLCHQLSLWCHHNDHLFHTGRCSNEIRKYSRKFHWKFCFLLT